MNNALGINNYLGLLFLMMAFSGSSISQVNCDTTFYSVFGSPVEVERGYSLAASLDSQSVFVGGIKGDSAVILNIDLSGNMNWSRTFDIIPGKQEHIFKLLVDAEGMIGLSGIAGTPLAGGTIFVCRYNPISNQMLWARELISTSTNYNQGMIEKGSGGNYLVSSNPQSPNVAELVEIDKNTGQIVPSFSRHYDLGSSETMYDLEYFEGAIYSAARFSDGGSAANMRNTLLKLNAEDGAVEWMKLGHKPAAQPARLYGIDLTITQNSIFSVYLGDDDGTNLVTGTKVFIQMTDLDGNLKWLKHYELPGTNDWVDEIISTQGGLVILCRNRVAPSDLILFKIDYTGQVIWSMSYDYSDNDNSISLGSLQSQLIQIDEHFYFTAFSEEASDANLVLVKTTLTGEVGDTCIFAQPVDIPVVEISNPLFYSLTPAVSDYVPLVNVVLNNPGNATNFPRAFSCGSDAIVSQYVDAVICPDESFEGYNQTGTYQDTFMRISGCDSIRILSLIVLSPVHSMVDVSLCEGTSYEGYSMPGIYQDTFQNSDGCDSIRQLTLTASSPPPTNVSGQLCGDELFGYFEEGTYIDTLVSQHGCDSIRILTLVGTDIYIPNTFSPNDDGINDLFEVYISPNVEIDTPTFTIFDRFGNMVYMTENWPVQWDGKSKDGTTYNPAVFTYVFTYLCNGQSVLQKGDITLLR